MNKKATKTDQSAVGCKERTTGKQKRRNRNDFT
jgi:hypothetical protein